MFASDEPSLVSASTPELNCKGRLSWCTCMVKLSQLWTIPFKKV